MAGSSSLNDIAAGFPNPDREEGEISEDDMMNEVSWPWGKSMSILLLMLV